MSHKRIDIVTKEHIGCVIRAVTEHNEFEAYLMPTHVEGDSFWAYKRRRLSDEWKLEGYVRPCVPEQWRRLAHYQEGIHIEQDSTRLIKKITQQHIGKILTRYDAAGASFQGYYRPIALRKKYVWLEEYKKEGWRCKTQIEEAQNTLCVYEIVPRLTWTINTGKKA